MTDNAEAVNVVPDVLLITTSPSMVCTVVSVMASEPVTVTVPVTSRKPSSIAASAALPMEISPTKIVVEVEVVLHT